MTFLVTGATGFVGSAVARALVARGHAVRVLMRPNAAGANVRDLDVERVEGDLSDPASIKKAVKGCTGVFHVAADYRLWVPDPAAMFAINVDGTRALMHAAMDSGVERIVYTSSVATLGLAPGGAADEDAPSSYGDMIGPYKRSKFLAEQEVRRMVADRGLPAVIVNPSTPVGPGDIKPTPTGRVIRDAAAGRIPAFVDTGLNIVHVDDAAHGHVLAYEKGEIGARYILGGENLSLSQILAEIARLCGRRPPRIRLPHPVAMGVAAASEAWCRVVGGEPLATLDGVRMARKEMFFSSAKAERELGYAARPAAAAIADAVSYFQAALRLRPPSQAA